MTFIVIGFTHSYRDYFPMSDGYRPGAMQDEVTLSFMAGYLDRFTSEEIAEAVFEASNAPYAPQGLAGAIRARLEIEATFGGRQLRSLSVGDTVKVRGDMLACERMGWKRVAYLA